LTQVKVAIEPLAHCGGMAKTLFILNEGPYGNERAYNALRLATSVSRREGEEVRVFLMGDAAACGKAGQKVPPGYYNIETMLGNVVRHRGEISACGTCMDARGIADADLAPGVRRWTLEQLTDWTLWSDRVLVF
jgi:uncharacterized protein involved in oxidation of intracellular sulfur